MITDHPTVRLVMTKKPVTARVDTPFKELVRLLKSHGISALPIVDRGGRLVGIVSEADLLVKEEHAGGELAVPDPLTEADRVTAVVAADVMTWPVLTVRGSASVAKAARLMQDSAVRHLVVVAGDGRPIGIVSRSDLLNVYLRPDAEIKQQAIYGVADGMLSIDPSSIGVEVEDGVVTVTGWVPDRATHHLFVSILGRLPGVIGIHDRLKTGGRAQLTNLKQGGESPC